MIDINLNFVGMNMNVSDFLKRLEILGSEFFKFNEYKAIDVIMLDVVDGPVEEDILIANDILNKQWSVNDMKKQLSDYENIDFIFNENDGFQIVPTDIVKTK